MALPIFLGLISLAFGLFDGTCYVDTAQGLSCNTTTNVCSSVFACIGYLNQTYREHNNNQSIDDYSLFTIILVNSTSCADMPKDNCFIDFGTSWTILGADPNQLFCCPTLSTEKNTRTRPRSLKLENLIIPVPPPKKGEQHTHLSIDCADPPIKLTLQNINVQGINKTSHFMMTASEGHSCDIDIIKSKFSNLKSVFQPLLVRSNNVNIFQSTFEDNTYSLHLHGIPLVQVFVMDSKFLSTGNLELFQSHSYFQNVEFIGLTNEIGSPIVNLQSSKFESVGCKFTNNIVRSYPVGAEKKGKGAIIYSSESELHLDSNTVFSNNTITTNTSKDRCGCISSWIGKINSFAQFLSNNATGDCSPGMSINIYYERTESFYFGGIYKDNIGAPLLSFIRTDGLNDPITSLTFDSRGALFQNNQCGNLQESTGCVFSVTGVPTKKATGVTGIANENDCLNICGQKNSACVISSKGNFCIVGSNSNFLCDSNGVCVQHWLNAKVMGLQVQWWLAIGGGSVFVLIVLFFLFGCCCGSCRNKKHRDALDANYTPLLDGHSY